MSEGGEARMTRQALVELALGYADAGFVCAESVFHALADLRGLRSAVVPAVATGFGGGMAYRGQICGALSGAVMGLGLWFGRSTPEKTEAIPYWFAGDFLDRWRAKRGCHSCVELLGLDLSSPEDHEVFDREGRWERDCKSYIADAAGLAYDMIDDIFHVCPSGSSHR